MKRAIRQRTKKAKPYPEIPTLYPLPQTVFKHEINPLALRTRPLLIPKSSLRTIPLLILLSRASTQSLSVVSFNTKQRTSCIRVPPPRSSIGSSAPTDRDAIGAYDADVADGVRDVRIWTSLLGLGVLADGGVGAARKVARACSADGAGPAVEAGGTVDLTMDEGRC